MVGEAGLYHYNQGMLSRLFKREERPVQARPPEQVISSARHWQRVLLWSAWLVPILLSVGTYALVWYSVLLPGRTVAELREASKIIFYGALASIVIGILIYQVQSILAQQVATSTELEHKVRERTQHITEVMMKLDEQNKSLLAFDQQKSEFVTLVSHELRAPLTNINGGLELLLSREQDLSAQTRGTLQLVSAEAQRLTHFVEMILNISAMESGQFPIVIEPVSVAGVIQHVIGQFANLPPDRLTMEIGKDLPLALADAHYLKSVVFHLVDNALKYAPESPVYVSAEAAGNMVELRVIDHGPGVPPDMAARLFDRFERLEARDSQSVYGYGLGLYMCKLIVESLKGDIRVESRPAPGAAFLVRIPAWEDNQK
jgi:signal transduction histidine kinase